MNRKRKHKPYKQGLYTPINKSKYIGKGIPRYLSSWELRFFRWCDTNTNIIEWGSENIIIPYLSPIDKKIHRYMVDNYVMIKEGNKISKYLIEIKPKKQTVAPTKHGNKKKSTILYEHMTWAVNQAKWDAASQWCNKNNIKFQIITEDHLFFTKNKQY